MKKKQKFLFGALVAHLITVVICKKMDKKTSYYSKNETTLKICKIGHNATMINATLDISKTLTSHIAENIYIASSERQLSLSKMLTEDELPQYLQNRQRKS